MNLLRLSGPHGRALIYSLADDFSEADAREAYMNKTGYDAFTAASSFSFDECSADELANFANTGEP